MYQEYTKNSMRWQLTTQWDDKQNKMCERSEDFDQRRYMNGIQA